jgi:hypothetical protein
MRKQLEKMSILKRLEYTIRVFTYLSKGIRNSGSGIFNTKLKLNFRISEIHLPVYNFCGPFTRLDERLARSDAPINKLDTEGT